MASPGPLLAALRTSGRLAVLTGAGIGAESGVPTFHDAPVILKTGPQTSDGHVRSP